MSASMFLVVLAAAILILMLLILKLKVHPVMALFSVPCSRASSWATACPARPI